MCYSKGILDQEIALFRRLIVLVITGISVGYKTEVFF